MRRAPLTTARLRAELLEDRCTPSHTATAFLATDLVSDQPGVARVTDPTLINPWGISLSPTGGAFWVSSNGGDLSEVYLGDVNGSPIIQPFKVSIPGGEPTGVVLNTTGSPTDFTVTDGTVSQPAIFIFASETGAITGWHPAVGITGVPPSTTAQEGFQATDDAIYKGLALAKVGSANFLYAADFHNDKIDVIDGQFNKVALGTGGFETFTDPNLPAGFAPFNIAAINGKLYVSYAKQDADADDDVARRGNGFVSVFETNGHFVGRLISRGDLNSPWGMVVAPAGFGDFGGDLLVGNFGDGRIHAYDLATGKKQGTLSESPGRPLVIDGLWGLAFGNGVSAGDANALYYAAGPDDETHGLFGKITANPAGTNPVTAVLVGSDVIITGSRNSDVVTVQSERSGGGGGLAFGSGAQKLVVRAGGQRIGTFDPASVASVRFTGFAGNDVFTVDPRVSVTIVADGGAGNDAITAGGGSSVLLGNAGNDVLVGGFGRDVLIGGDGRDVLFGLGNDDILVGGRTSHDGSATALLQILTAWVSPTVSYNDRVSAIRSGTGGVPKLDSTTVFDDGVRDDLFGGSGQDWFIGQLPDRLHGRRANEQIN